MTIGLKDLVYATITEGENSVPTYGTPKKLAEVMTADLSVTTAEGTLYADDAVSESVKEFVKGALKLGIKDLETEDVATLLGQEVDDDKVIYGGADDEPPYVAVTKGEAIQFNTPEIEGEFFKRHDGRWKADYTGLETSEVAKSFLTKVREPKTTASASTSGS